MKCRGSGINILMEMAEGFQYCIGSTLKLKEFPQWCRSIYFGYQLVKNGVGTVELYFCGLGTALSVNTCIDRNNFKRLIFLDHLLVLKIVDKQNMKQF